MERKKCRSCGASVVWPTSASTGRPMPLDADPDNERGNVLLDGLNRAHAFKDHAAAVAFQAATDDEMSSTYLSHHATCPQGSGWRGTQRGAADEPKPDPQLGLL